MHPTDPLEKYFTRLGIDQKRALTKLRIKTVHDLLYHSPARYEAAGPTGTIAGATAGTEVSLYGTIRKPDVRKTWKSRRPIAEAWLHDASGKIKLMWFNQPYLANPTIDRTPIAPEDVHDNLFTKGGLPDGEGLYAVYPESQGISSLWFLHAMKRLFEGHLHENISAPLPEEILKRYNLPTLSTALIWIHIPKSRANAEAARKRFAFEEVFAIQLGMQKRRVLAAHEKALPVSVNREALSDFVASFPFPPTNAQKKSIEDIVRDFEKSHPMTRLLEGDVGSGKTAVAAATSYLVATSRPPNRNSGTLQVAYMCPTEILAKQHFSTFISHFKDHPIQIGLITGTECRKFPSKIRREESTHISKAQFRKWVENGEIPIVIGTHALIEKTLVFQNLAYAIIDEQHRFGKIHRQELVRKHGIVPHLLSMTATPIPRTLALTIYGDLDLSLLDEMPLGRKPVMTSIVTPDNRSYAYEKIREELSRGRQLYVICPRIDEPDPTKELAIQAKSVQDEANRERTGDAEFQRWQG